MIHHASVDVAFVTNSDEWHFSFNSGDEVHPLVGCVAPTPDNSLPHLGEELTRFSPVVGSQRY